MPRPVKIFKLTIQLTCIAFIIILINYVIDNASTDLKNAEFWQPVHGSKHIFMVFSAFEERRKLLIEHIESPVIRIIGLAKLNLGNISEQPFIDDTVYCRLWSEEEPATRVTLLKAHVLPMHEHWSLAYTACFIFCPILPHSKNASIVAIYAASAAAKFLGTGDEKDLPEAGNRLLINRPQERKEDTSSLAVCVKPLYNNYGNVWELIEWIEVNKILGISHFYFYNHEVSSKVRCVLDEYARRGEATVMDWKNGAPVASQIEVRTVNMFAALNDCLYRGMGEHKYLAVFDVDEFLAPKKSAFLLELIKEMSSGNKSVASFVFRNAFFYMRWHNDPLYKGVDLKTLKRTRRKRIILPSEMRAKFVFQPELVFEVGNHAVWSVVDGAVNEAVVPVNKGLLHHYRRCEYGDDNCLITNSVRDRSMWKHRRLIEKKVITAQNELMGKCGIGAFGYVDGSKNDNDTFPFPDIDDFY